MRSAEIEQVYLGLLPLIDTIKLSSDFSSSQEMHSINWESDLRPNYSDTLNNNANNWSIDTAELINELTKWLNTGQVPLQGVDEGISKKLLNEMVSKLDGSMKRMDEQIEVIIGLQNIEAFLGHVEALKNDDDMPIQKTESNEFTINHYWNEKSTQGDWDTFPYNAIEAPKPEVEQELTVKKFNEPAEKMNYYFQVENESFAGGVYAVMVHKQKV